MAVACAAVGLAGFGPVPGPARAATAGPLTPVATWWTPKFAHFYSANVTTEAFSSAAVGDVLGDGNQEVVAGFPDGMVYGWHTDGTMFLAFSAGAGAIQGSPVLADLDGDGVLDILVVTTAGRVLAVDGHRRTLFDHSDGVLIDPNHGVFGTPVVADIDGDGKPEIIVGSWDEFLHAWRLDGSELPGFPRLMYDTVFSSPTVTDLLGDGRLEIVVGGDCAGVQGQPCFDGTTGHNHGGYVWAIQSDGSDLPGWPHFIPGQTVWSSPAVADLFGDGRREVVVGTGLNYPSTSSDPTPGWKVYAIDASGHDLPGWPVPVGGRVMASPAIGDIDGDATPDIVTVAEDGRVYAHDPAGHLLPGWPQCLASVGGSCPVALHASVTVADVLGTGHQQVIAGGEQWIRVFDGGGGIIGQQPTKAGTAPLSAAPTVASVSGQTWIVQTATFLNPGATLPDQGAVWIWTTGVAPGFSAWPAFKHDARRSSLAFVGAASVVRAVSREAGADRFATAAAVSAATFQPGVPVAYVATGLSYPDALAGTPAAARAGGPILLVTQTSIPGPTVGELSRLRPGRIVVLGGPDAVSDAVMSQLGAYTSGSVTRIQGSDRYATSAAISAASFNPGVPVAYVATGERFPDALAGGAAAAKKGGPVLLVQSGSVPPSVQNELARLQPGSIIVLGGPSAVSDAVVSQLAVYARGGGVRRVAGNDRYQTSAAVAADAFSSPVPAVYVATGQNFPDALAGGVAAGRQSGPLLLVPSTLVPASIRTAVNALHPGAAVILGGPGAIYDVAAFQFAY